MRNILLISVLLCFFNRAFSQIADTNTIKRLYDKSLGISEDRVDSILANAAFIEEQSEKLQYSKGQILAKRLRGLASEYSGNYQEAINHYLVTLDLARVEKSREYEIAALSDIAIVYSEIKQPQKAREVYLQCLKIALEQGEINTTISSYTNIGAIYNQLDQPDSALFFLNNALELSNRYNLKQTLPVIYNNTGNVYFRKKNFTRAIEYFRLNKQIHDSTGNKSDLWYDNLNIADCHLEAGIYDSATHYLDIALDISRQLKSRQKEADSYSLYTKLYEKLGRYKQAYTFQKKWYTLDTALVNETSSKTIAEMQERFNARDREKQNKLLVSEVDREKLKNKNLSLLVLAAFIIALLVGISLLVYRRANLRLQEVNIQIQKQKEKMAILNKEKNTLIGIVSHDLGAPLASIGMWSNLLAKEDNLTTDQQKALERIRASAQDGEKLIRNILEVEREGSKRERIELEETDIASYLNWIVGEFRGMADAKGIKLEFPETVSGVFLLTDQAIFRRIIENLVSNAIKYTEPGKSVYVKLVNTDGHVELIVEDEGVGIPESKQNLLFTPYANIGNRTTDGEASSGLGLSIVKRLVNELNGTIQYQLANQGGSVFKVRFGK
ncbi:tetratricopeptide repeat-containing sensor histidine kinase [Flavihumibacter sp.]|uniref:tetratricopeptide repeat-containing sensor histidine kinase n=1 Tax=Flavihumibacter sp. TaxID=1913981 RepID=UPI002FC68576|nr:ATP-binding protein [Flavihumibacter sediminis]